MTAKQIRRLSYGSDHQSRTTANGAAKGDQQMHQHGRRISLGQRLYQSRSFASGP